MKNKKLQLFLGGMILLLILAPAKTSSAAKAKTAIKKTTVQASLKASVRSLHLKQKKFARDTHIEKHPRNIFQDDSEILSISDVPNDCNISFRSSNPSVLSVEQETDTTCRYTGIRSGTAKIIIKISRNPFFFFEEKRTLRAKITVSPHAASIMFHQSVRKIRKGQKAKLSVTIRPSITKERPIFWSLNPKIVSIGKRGVIHGKKIGSTYVMARIANGKTARCKIIVRKKKKNMDNNLQINN